MQGDMSYDSEDTSLLTLNVRLTPTLHAVHDRKYVELEVPLNVSPLDVLDLLVSDWFLLHVFVHDNCAVG